MLRRRGKHWPLPIIAWRPVGRPKAPDGVTSGGGDLSLHGERTTSQESQRECVVDEQLRTIRSLSRRGIDFHVKLTQPSRMESVTTDAVQRLG